MNETGIIAIVGLHMVMRL